MKETHIQSAASTEEIDRLRQRVDILEAVNAKYEKSQRELAESENFLRQSEERLELFFAQSLDGFFFMMLDEPVYWNDTVNKEQVLDYVFAHQRVTKINDAMLEQYRATREEFLGKTPNDLFSHDLEQGKLVWCQFFDTGHLHIDTDERKFDGTPMWIEGDYICMYDSQGRITGHFGIQRDVTARKKTEEALAEKHRELQEAMQQIEQSRNMLELIIESIPVRVFWKDKDLRYLGCNSLFARDAGFSHPQQLLGKDDFVMVWKDQAELYRKNDVDVMELRKSRIHIIEPQTTPDGNIIWLNTSKVPLQTSDGKVFGILGVYEDITKRKLAEDALRESDSRRLALFENARDAIIITDTQTGIILDVNSQAEVLLGLTKEQLIGMHQAELHPKERQATVTAQLQEHSQSGHKLVETEIVTADGWIIPVEVSASMVSLPNGNVVLQGIFRDIKERKETENALRESEARFRSLFDQTHDAVFILNLNGKHIAVNQRASEMLGYTPDEMMELSVNDTSAETEKSQEVLTRLMAGEHVPVYERLFRKKDGQVVPVEINVELVSDKSGRPLHIQSIVREISKRKQAEKALKEANEQMRNHVTEIEQLQKELREQALRDPLTGLYNRRHLEDTLERESGRAMREKKPFSVIVMDVDHFKKVNDTHGHQVGDQFLKAIANLITAHIRITDTACRYGGEEFLLVMPGANSRFAIKRANELRQKCAELAIIHKNKELHITISMGVATYPTHSRQTEEILMMADKALYNAKRSGRNRVIVWAEDGKRCKPYPRQNRKKAGTENQLKSRSQRRAESEAVK